MKKNKQKKTPKHAKAVIIPEQKKINWGIYFFVIFILVLTAAAMISWDKFTIREIKINGLHDVQYLDVVNLTGIEYMKNIFSVNLSDVEKKVEQNPYLDVTNIKRTFPDVIEIDVIERRPIAIAYTGVKYLILSKDCVVLGILEDKGEQQYINIEGIEISSFQLGEAMKITSYIKTEKLTQLLMNFEEADIYSLINKIDISFTENIKLYANAGYEIHLGNTDNIENKCIWIKTMIPELIARGETEGILYISNVDTAHFESMDD